MRRLFALFSCALCAVVLSACQTFPDPVGNSFVFCDRQAEACYRSCENRIDRDPYAICQEQCGADANRCFANANAQRQFSAPAVAVVDPWFGQFGAWYPAGGYFFTLNRYNRFGLRRAWGPPGFVGVGPRRFGYGRPFAGPRRAYRPYRAVPRRRAIRRAVRRDRIRRDAIRRDRIRRNAVRRDRVRRGARPYRGDRVRDGSRRRNRGAGPNRGRRDGVRGQRGRRDGARRGGNRRPQGRPPNRRPQGGRNRPRGRGGGGGGVGNDGVTPDRN